MSVESKRMKLQKILCERSRKRGLTAAGGVLVVPTLPIVRIGGVILVDLSSVLMPNLCRNYKALRRAAFTILV